MSENIVQKLFQPSERGKIWRIFLLIIILIVIGGLIDAGDYYNRGTTWVANKTGYSINLPKVKEVPFRLGLDLQGGSHLVYKADMSNIADKDKVSALEGVRDVIERRVNVFGVSEPNIQTNVSGEEYRVIAELAGIKDVNEAIKMIGETPLLEFKEQIEQLRELTEEERQQMNEKRKKTNPFNEAETEKEIKAAHILICYEGIDSCESGLTQEEAMEKVNKLKTEANPQNFAKLARENSTGPSGPSGGDLGWFDRASMVKPFSDAVFNQGNGTISDIVETEFGYHLIYKQEERDIEEYNISHIFLRTITEKDIIGDEKDWENTELTGKNLDRALVQFDPNTIPTVNSKITGGRAVISGSFNIKEAKLLAQRLNAGALPVPIELINQQTVGATLGKASMAESLKAGLLGLLLEALFMVLFYRLPGVIAVISLTIYGILVLAIFKIFSVTLTLAGLAGFILSIGMAVDANVLIFERLKEELKNGKPLSLAINDSFDRAWPSIRDGNVSTLLTCIILIWFSTSIVKGFAITLFLGVCISMFSAIIVTKTFLKILNKNFPKYNILAEESGSFKNGSNYTFVIDPLDGTNSFALGIPYFAVAIGLMENNEEIFSCVYNPILNETYYAKRGNGAYRNYKKIIVNKKKYIDSSVVALVAGYSTMTETRKKFGKKLYDNNVSRILDNWCPTLDYCLLASGKIECVLNNDDDKHEAIIGNLIINVAQAISAAFSF